MIFSRTGLRELHAMMRMRIRIRIKMRIGTRMRMGMEKYTKSLPGGGARDAEIAEMWGYGDAGTQIAAAGKRHLSLGRYTKGDVKLLLLLWVGFTMGCTNAVIVRTGNSGIKNTYLPTYAYNWERETWWRFGCGIAGVRECGIAGVRKFWGEGVSYKG